MKSKINFETNEIIDKWFLAGVKKADWDIHTKLIDNHDIDNLKEEIEKNEK